MRVLVLFATVLLSCAPSRHAETFVRRGSFSGERWVFVSADDRDHEDALEKVLRRRGFRVSRGLRDVRGTVRAGYVLEVRGRCPDDILMRKREREIKVEVFNAELERVFAAHLDSISDCPDAFFAEVAASLDRNWERQYVDGADPDLPRR